MSRDPSPQFATRVGVLVCELQVCDPEDDELVLGNLNDLIKLATAERAHRFPDGWIEAGLPLSPRMNLAACARFWNDSTQTYNFTAAQLMAWALDPPA